ncbi:TPA: hypothetical protein ACIAH4_004424 [Enterobacter roggenkampii]
MDKFKGTPGPWVNVGGWVDAERSGALSSIVCAINWAAPRNPESVNDANAQLISAAPELLEALQDFMANASGEAESCGHSFECVCRFDKAKAAIAKALGK